MEATELVMRWISQSLEEVLEALSDRPIGHVVMLVDGEHTAVVSNLGLDLSTEVLRDHVRRVEQLAGGS